MYITLIFGNTGVKNKEDNNEWELLLRKQHQTARISNR